MDRTPRSYYIDESIDRVRRNGVEAYFNLYASEIKKLQKRYPDLEVKPAESIHTHRKILCVIRLKPKA